MNDIDWPEGTPEELKIVVIKTIEILDLMSDVEDPKQSLKIMSIIVSHTLCMKVANEDLAHDMFDMLINDVETSVMATKSSGFTCWVEGTPH